MVEGKQEITMAKSTEVQRVSVEWARLLDTGRQAYIEASGQKISMPAFTKLILRQPNLLPKKAVKGGLIGMLR